MTVNVDLVRGEFEKLLRADRTRQRRATAALDQALRSNFADGDGRLPRTSRSSLATGARCAVGRRALRRDEARQRDRPDGPLLGTYFDGDASKLALLLDPTRQHSPMHQFRGEIAGFERSTSG